MRLRWYGQSAFSLTGSHTVFIDPFGDIAKSLNDRGVHFGYPLIEDATADLLLITHEHLDHNAAEIVGGDPQVIRSTAGRFESPVGEVVAIASEHDAAAGTERGPNTIFVFELDGLRVCHFGDFGQSELRDEQAAAIGTPDVLIVPIGGGPTIDGGHAAAIARRLGARLVVPMHYRTPAIGFLDGPDAFLAEFGDDTVRRADSEQVELDGAGGDGPVAVIPQPPR